MTPLLIIFGVLIGVSAWDSEIDLKMSIGEYFNVTYKFEKFGSALKKNIKDGAKCLN